MMPAIIVDILRHPQPFKHAARRRYHRHYRGGKAAKLVTDPLNSSSISREELGAGSSSIHPRLPLPRPTSVRLVRPTFVFYSGKHCVLEVVRVSHPRDLDRHRLSTPDE